MKVKDIGLLRGDYISLGKAVAKFNRTINELRTEENKTYLPEQIKYQDIKERIVSKTELQRYIKNLRQFKKENSDVYITEGEEKITTWERNVIEEERQIALRRMKRNLKKISPYDKEAIEGIKATIENLKNFEKIKNTKESKNFEDTKRRIHRIGTTDYELRKAIIYKQNYYKALEEIKNYEFYDVWKKRLDRYKNPINLFKFIDKSDIMKELFTYYKGGKGLVIGAFATDEDAFNSALVNDYDYNLEEIRAKRNKK